MAYSSMSYLHVPKVPSAVTAAEHCGACRRISSSVGTEVKISNSDWCSDGLYENKEGGVLERGVRRSRVEGRGEAGIPPGLVEHRFLLASSRPS
jgi:hypothetical protein